jgi:HKD family nuclease
MLNLITEKWNDEFNVELKKTECLRIISPFITDNIIRNILAQYEGSKIKVITRFNLNDFHSGVSSISALNRLVDRGAEIFGIHNLHSKVYIFDTRSAIITSANLTTKAFYNNFEFGIKTTEKDSLNKTIDYFNWLRKIGGKKLNQNQIHIWEDLLKKVPANKKGEQLPDYGKVPVHAKEPQYFVKFLGSQTNRVENDFEAITEIERAHCHYALCYPDNGTPRRYKDGDVVFIARLLKQRDYAFFGRAITLHHVKDRDRVSNEELLILPWKKAYPVYIRIKDVEFLNTSMGNCPTMNQLINLFNEESFSKTQQRYLAGEKNINPKNSLRQRADIQLSTMAGIWLEEAFKLKKEKLKLVPKKFLDKLHQGSTFK